MSKTIEVQKRKSAGPDGFRSRPDYRIIVTADPLLERLERAGQKAAVAFEALAEIGRYREIAQQVTAGLTGQKIESARVRRAQNDHERTFHD